MHPSRRLPALLPACLLAPTTAAGADDPAPRFVAGPRSLVRYNSRLPIVVMVPEGCELTWLVWRADPELLAAETR